MSEDPQHLCLLETLSCSQNFSLLFGRDSYSNILQHEFASFEVKASVNKNVISFFFFFLNFLCLINEIFLCWEYFFVCFVYG